MLRIGRDDSPNPLSVRIDPECYITYIVGPFNVDGVLGKVVFLDITDATCFPAPWILNIPFARSKVITCETRRVGVVRGEGGGVDVGGGKAFKYYRQYFLHCPDKQISVIFIVQNDGKKP